MDSDFQEIDYTPYLNFDSDDFFQNDFNPQIISYLGTSISTNDFDFPQASVVTGFQSQFSPEEFQGDQETVCNNEIPKKKNKIDIIESSDKPTEKPNEEVIVDTLSTVTEVTTVEEPSHLFTRTNSKYLHNFFMNEDFLRYMRIDVSPTSIDINDNETLIMYIIETKKTLLRRKMHPKLRKFKPDDIRKKIKSSFHKVLNSKVNQILYASGAKIVFDCLPQCFICNISKEMNKNVMNMEYIKLLSTDFTKGMKEGKKKNIDYEKYRHNVDVIQYLFSNPDILNQSGFRYLAKRTYASIIEEYFNSEEFNNAVKKLKDKESEIYIREYIIKAKHYVSFYSN